MYYWNLHLRNTTSTWTKMEHKNLPACKSSSPRNEQCWTFCFPVALHEEPEIIYWINQWRVAHLNSLMLFLNSSDELLFYWRDPGHNKGRNSTCSCSIPCCLLIIHFKNTLSFFSNISINFIANQWKIAISNTLKAEFYLRFTHTVYLDVHK